jgi:hypothetical protein
MPNVIDAAPQHLKHAIPSLPATGAWLWERVGEAGRPL